MLVFWPVYRIQLWTCFNKRSLFTITKDNNISDKSRATIKNGLCSQLNAAEKYDTMGPLKLLRHLEVTSLLFFLPEKRGVNRSADRRI